MRQLTAIYAIAAFSMMDTAAKADEAEPEHTGFFHILGEIIEDAYGPNIHSDGTGRAFQWRTRDGQVTNTPVKRNAYGLGVGMDAYGRPVKAIPND